MRNRERLQVCNEHGAALLDVLIALVLISLISAGLTLNSITASQALLKLQRKIYSQQLAQSKLEEFAMIDPSLLDDSYDDLELGVQAEGIDFVRQVDVTVNADGSRSVEVSVAPASTSPNGGVTLTNRFVEWGLN